jgi:LPXTG-motif cell wall-anchored protein
MPSSGSSVPIAKRTAKGDGKDKEKRRDEGRVKIPGLPVVGSPTNVLVLLGLGIAGLVVFFRSRKKKISEDFGAFIQRLEILPPPQPAPPIAPHPLSGLTFAVKDM